MNQRLAILRRKIDLLGERDALKKAIEEVNELRVELETALTFFDAGAGYLTQYYECIDNASREMADVKVAVADTFSLMIRGFKASMEEKEKYVYEEHLPKILK